MLRNSETSGLDSRNLIDSSELSPRKDEPTSSCRLHFSRLVWLHTSPVKRERSSKAFQDRDKGTSRVVWLVVHYALSRKTNPVHGSLILFISDGPRGTMGKS